MSGVKIGDFFMQEECDFSEVFLTMAPGEDTLDCREYPVTKIGHVRADYDGRRWYGQYFPCRDDLKTDAFKKESQEIYKEFVTKFKNLDLLRKFCLEHPESRIGQDEYNFFINGKAANYHLRIITRWRDYNLYLHSFSKTKR